MTMSTGVSRLNDARLYDLRSMRHTRGFTIVETMVVLTVTGALFVAIAATLTGRQNNAEFVHAIQSVQSQLQQTIDQVSAGYYPNQKNFSCQQSGAASISIGPGSSSLGTNQACVFLGKVIQLGIQNTDPEEYRIYTIAGLSTATNGATSPFQSASPTVVGVGGDYTTYSDVRQLEYGLTTVWVRSNGNSGCIAKSCSIGAVGFLMEPGSLDSASTSGYNSGAQPIDLIPIRPTSLGQDITQGVSGIESSSGGGLRDPALSTGAPVNPSMGVQICFASGGTNQSGLITIGSSGRQLLVKLDIKTNRTCS